MSDPKAATDDDRRALAERQRQLVAALQQGGGASDFDPQRLAIAARSLRGKRARAVIKTWPRLRAGLGERYDELFAQYARLNALPARVLDDGRRFAEWLARQGLLDDAARLTLMQDRARGGWPVRMARMRRSNRLALAIRIPLVGIVVVQIPFPAARITGAAHSANS